MRQWVTKIIGKENRREKIDLHTSGKQPLAILPWVAAEKDGWPT